VNPYIASSSLGDIVRSSFRFFGGLLLFGTVVFFTFGGFDNVPIRYKLPIASIINGSKLEEKLKVAHVQEYFGGIKVDNKSGPITQNVAAIYNAHHMFKLGSGKKLSITPGPDAVTDAMRAIREANTTFHSYPGGDYYGVRVNGGKIYVYFPNDLTFSKGDRSTFNAPGDITTTDQFNRVLQSHYDFDVKVLKSIVQSIETEKNHYIIKNLADQLMEISKDEHDFVKSLLNFSHNALDNMGHDYANGALYSLKTRSGGCEEFASTVATIAAASMEYILVKEVKRRDSDGGPIDGVTLVGLKMESKGLMRFSTGHVPIDFYPRKPGTIGCVYQLRPDSKLIYLAPGMKEPKKLTINK